MVTLPAGEAGVYHYDFRTKERRVEVKQGVGYNLDTLFRIAAGAERWSDCVVFCDKALFKIWKRYASEVSRLKDVKVRFDVISAR